ncbi:Asp-tRNA(Asn)/Glu-tRNA(Gln) amidotransferase subunit GatA [Candidatus Saccharibacteria bacterium]|nr:Asp-tRNA(Asn)/Glu-tRNA(Gln) amidotransferase subunit GatA [Candidatus Saccharibacteria bacterium]MBI2285428.1 Asp-tRNA(Asn)/Glu-tRNA(Gln) amidotransferase subunit GatA [Candidatus Saccharibacteria bacterium]
MGALELPISDIAAKVQSGELSAKKLVQEAITNLEAASEYEAIISYLKSRALQRAEEIDAKVAQGEKIGSLAGVPFVTKDNFLTLGGKTTAASNMLKDFTAPYQATAIERLEAAGAICVAKANLDAWAHGSSTENSDFFVTKNPHDKTRVPGGSSGGSAAVVALKAVSFAIGTDTGGSIRLPASFCGVVGYKPTYGLVSRSGVVAMASSTDVIGPLARTVDDAALVLDAMAGKDELDGTTIDRNHEGYNLQNSKFKIQNSKIGIIREYMSEGLEIGVKQSIEAAIEKFRQAGAQVNEISLPSLPLALAVYYIVCPAEVSSNLARYDGQRYGHSKARAKTLQDSYFLSREEGFGAEAKRRIMIGAYVLSSGYYEAYYKKAQTVRTKIINEFKAAFERFDFLVGPTAPNTAFKIGERTDDPLKMYLSDIMTVAANISGNPAVSLPISEDGGLPIGLQIIAPQKADRALLSISKAIEELK